MLQPYLIVVTDDLEELENNVNEQMALGYVPLGTMQARSKFFMINGTGLSSVEYVQVLILPKFLSNNNHS